MHQMVLKISRFNVSLLTNEYCAINHRCGTRYIDTHNTYSCVDVEPKNQEVEGDTERNYFSRWARLRTT